MTVACTLCPEEGSWVVEWGVRDVQREPRRGGQLVCGAHIGAALDRRPYDAFRLSRLNPPPSRNRQRDVFLTTD